MSAHVMRMHRACEASGAQSVAPPVTLGPRVCETCSARSPCEPALRGMPRSVLGAIVGGDRSYNELTS